MTFNCVATQKQPFSPFLTEQKYVFANFLKYDLCCFSYTQTLRLCELRLSPSVRKQQTTQVKEEAVTETQEICNCVICRCVCFPLHVKSTDMNVVYSHDVLQQSSILSHTWTFQRNQSLVLQNTNAITLL